MEKAILVGVNLNDGEDYQYSLQELENLARACGMETVGVTWQTLPEIHKAFYIGTGKVEEVKETAEETDAELIIFDNSLTPMQLRNLQDKIGRPILDRSILILNIFEKRAQSREAKLQVEAARLQYMLPRLVGLHAALSRQGGGSGSMSNRGAGEKKLELDRRVLERRLTECQRELKTIGSQWQVQQKQRAASGIPRISLVGYTNAGKSTLLNAMLELYGTEDNKAEEKRVMERDMLFATLTTTVRRIAPDGHPPFLLSDTVGFIHKLPHHLIEAFRSTLEEAKEADVLLLVADYSDSHYKEQIAVTRNTLKELGADRIPVIYVYNKADKVSADEIPGRHALPAVTHDSIYLSAREKNGMEELVCLIEKKLADGYRECTMRIPYTDGRAVSYLKENAAVHEIEYQAEGIYLKANCREQDYRYYEKYVI